MSLSAVHGRYDLGCTDTIHAPAIYRPADMRSLAAVVTCSARTRARRAGVSVRARCRRGRSPRLVVRCSRHAEPEPGTRRATASDLSIVGEEKGSPGWTLRRKGGEQAGYRGDQRSRSHANTDASSTRCRRPRVRVRSVMSRGAAVAEGGIMWDQPAGGAPAVLPTTRGQKAAPEAQTSACICVVVTG